jgi:hypothetical protein
MSIFLGECMAVGCDGMLGSTAQECIRIGSENKNSTQRTDASKLAPYDIRHLYNKRNRASIVKTAKSNVNVKFVWGIFFVKKLAKNEVIYF